MFSGYKYLRNTITTENIFKKGVSAKKYISMARFGITNTLAANYVLIANILAGVCT
jgi:hypothetical protein